MHGRLVCRSWLRRTGTRSTADRGGNRKAGKNLPQPGRRRSRRLRHRPSALGLRGTSSSGFCDALGRLGSSDRWLDIGAGDGQAILDYYAPEDDAAPAEKCARSGGKARAVAMSIEDRRTDTWQQQAASLGETVYGISPASSLRHYSVEELGKFQIITDVYGGFSYTEDLSRFMEKVLSLLEIGGVFYTIVQTCI